MLHVKLIRGNNFFPFKQQFPINPIFIVLASWTNATIIKFDFSIRKIIIKDF